VMIARIRHDITLTDFEKGIRDLMRDVEDAYWELYFTYRDLEARKTGRDSALETWRRIKTIQRVGSRGGEASNEAQSRSQFFLFRAQAEAAQTNLFRVENRLRYMMGLAVSDGRLIRPSDEPTTAQVSFDWATIHFEALAKRTELRNQRWQIKRRELELIASRNHLLPRLDAVGRYRWYGAGDDLLNSRRRGIPPFLAGSNAFDVLTSGDFQEWEMGLQLSIPIGFRRAMVGVRHYQLLLARERAVLEDLELEVSHQLGDAIRDVDLNYAVTQTNFNRRVAAADEVEAVKAVYEVGNVTLDQLLDAQRRQADADSAYYRSLVDYNRAIMRAHHRKGSLLEYNGVYLEEGPWPGKAYFDALRRARQRDASTYLDYGFTRPNVVSRGLHGQFTHTLPAAAEPTLGSEEFNDSTLKLDKPVPAAGTPPEQEVIPVPGQPEGAPSSDVSEVGGGLATLPAVEQVAADISTIEPANFQAEAAVPAEQTLPLVVPGDEPQRAAQVARPPLPLNPYRNEFANWNAKSALISSGAPPTSNILRLPNPLQQKSVNWIRQQQGNADEPHSDRTTAETAPDPAGW